MIENLHWRKISIKLSVLMYGFTTTISDGYDHLLIVGHDNVNKNRDKGTYKIIYQLLISRHELINNTIVTYPQNG